jgi:ferredoxin
MKLHIIYFSPNGSTLKSLRNIAKGFYGIEQEEHNLLLPQSRQKKYRFGSDDIVLMGMSTAGMLFGKVDETFNCLEGSNTPFIGVVSYGNGYYGVSLRQMKAKAERKGFVVAGLGAFIGRHAISTDVGAGRPDAKDAAVQEKFGRDVLLKINSGNSFKLTKKPAIGWSGLWKFNIVVAIRLFMQQKEYELPHSLKEKHVNDDCVTCMKCEKNCPVQAIDIRNRHFDLSKCIACCSCINHCPEQAITSASKVMISINKDFSKAFRDIRKEPYVLY